MATGGQRQIGCNLVQFGILKLKHVCLQPSGIVVSGDIVMVTNCISHKVHVYKRQDGMLLSSLNTLEAWCGVCFINDNEICVALMDGTIERMSVQDNGVVKRQIKFGLQQVFAHCHGVAKFKANVVVCGIKHDTICWCVVSLKDGSVDTVYTICKGERSHLTTKDNMVYISCFASHYLHGNAVYGFNLLNPDQKPFIYRHKELSHPCGITVDDNGFVFLCNFGFHNSIHQLTDKCELVSIHKEGMPRNPCDIFCYHGVLYVIGWSNEIALYQKQFPHQQGPSEIRMYRKDQKEKVTHRVLVVGWYEIEETMLTICHLGKDKDIR